MKYKYIRLFITGVIASTMLFTACGKTVSESTDTDISIESEDSLSVTGSDEQVLLKEKEDTHVDTLNVNETDQTKELSNTEKETESKSNKNTDKQSDKNTGISSDKKTETTTDSKTQETSVTDTKSQTSQTTATATPTPTPTSTPATVHTHEWEPYIQKITFDAVTEELWVVDQEAYEEEVAVYEYKSIARCACGAEITDDPGSHLKEHAMNGDPYGSWRSEYVKVQTGTKNVYHEEVGHYETKIISDAYTEEILIAKCSCGATKEVN